MRTVHAERTCGSASKPGSHPSCSKIQSGWSNGGIGPVDLHVDLAAWRPSTIREALRDHGADTALL